MREFTNKSHWDAENQDWLELYYIDGQEVDIDTYTEQLEVEELTTEEDELCNCSDCVAEREELEDEEECYCRECNKEREDKLITECLDMVFDPDACVNCTIDKVIETMYHFKFLGEKEIKQDMKDFFRGLVYIESNAGFIGIWVRDYIEVLCFEMALAKCKCHLLFTEICEEEDRFLKVAPSSLHPIFYLFFLVV